MATIKPVNGHLIIEPVKHEAFIATQNETYQEIGVVVDAPVELEGDVKIGDKVYFDSWLAAKFPTEKEDEYLWLVKWEHIRAVESND